MTTHSVKTHRLKSPDYQAIFGILGAKPQFYPDYIGNNTISFKVGSGAASPKDWEEALQLIKALNFRVDWGGSDLPE